jgi:hypothetical protein
MVLKRYFFIPLLLLCGQLFSQLKTLPAVKTNQAPKIDGSLSDLAWGNAPVATEFIQNYPSTGQPASQKTEVRILYDNSAIYVAAYLYDDASLIRKQITARDEELQKDVDFFSIFFDTYNDRQNGFQFVVTSANVQSDARLGPNLGSGGGFGEYGDKTWDAVWESKVKMQNDGWTVEMKIPYISLRFAKKDMQSWGIQFLRLIRRTNETCFWNPVDPQVNGLVNQFGDFTGLMDLEPPLRLSFSPYVSTGYRKAPNETGGFKSDWLRSGGMDVKWGINESYTLDATLIPDFGQVVSDNVINNLSPYEVRFQENRPFFTEGTEIFNKAGLFYSRRVGATPSGYNGVRNFVSSNTNWEVVNNPSLTQLYNATKFSGRSKNKLGVGIFNAVASPSEAKIRNRISGKDSVISTSSLTNYNILVLDQALEGRSYITLTNTNVLRNGNGRDANVTAFDYGLYDKTNTYLFGGTARYSKIWEANPYDGFSTTVRFAKVSGNWQYSFLNSIESKQYDPNDLGFLSAPNKIQYRGNISYNQFVPTSNFITYNYSFSARAQYLYKPYAFNKVDFIGSGFWIFKNFWDVRLETIITPNDRNYFELRTDGKFIYYPFNYIITGEGSTDSRKKLYVSYEAVFARAPKFDNTYYAVDLGFRYRFNNKFTLSLDGATNWEGNQLGYAFLRESNGDPIAGFRDNTVFESILSGIYNFTPRLNLTLRTRHYWNEVLYKSFHNVDANGKLITRAFIAGQDENFNIFNTDVFLTWDFRLGSRLIVGYKNWLGDDEIVPFASKNSYLRNLGEIFDLRHGNEFTVRFIYFLDYNQLRKKR